VALIFLSLWAVEAKVITQTVTFRQDGTEMQGFQAYDGGLNVYHLSARSEYGCMVRIIAGLITCLLLPIYRRKPHQEKVTIKLVRELRLKILHEARDLDSGSLDTRGELNFLQGKT